MFDLVDSESEDEGSVSGRQDSGRGSAAKKRNGGGGEGQAPGGPGDSQETLDYDTRSGAYWKRIAMTYLLTMALCGRFMASSGDLCRISLPALKT